MGMGHILHAVNARKVIARLDERAADEAPPVAGRPALRLVTS
jgi:hypothetical protein